VFNFQDHLELYNGAIRASLGQNNNPTCRQFEAIFKRLLVKLDLQNVRGNCQKRDETALLVLGSTKKLPKATQSAEEDCSILDDSMLVSIYFKSNIAQNLGFVLAKVLLKKNENNQKT